MKRHLTAVAGPKIDKALEKHSHTGETVVWEFTMAPVQFDPTHPPQMMLHLVFWVPGPMLDQIVSSMALVANPLGIDQDAADEMVLGLLRHLREQKSQMLAQAMSQAEGQAGVNGHQPSGLILPGQ